MRLIPIPSFEGIVNNRERALAVLNYQKYDRLPLIHFGFWEETLRKWAAEGHLTTEEAQTWHDRSPTDAVIGRKLGFDCNWGNRLTVNTRLFPPLEEQVIEGSSDGSRKVLNGDGAIVIQKQGVTSIPAEVDHLLKGRKEWKEFFLPRLQFVAERITRASVNTGEQELPFDGAGLEYLRRGERQVPYGLWAGSLLGVIRNWLGLVGFSYLQVDDPTLFDEIIETVGTLCYQCTQYALETGAKFDFAHFWEDICFRSGPLINPRVFRQKVGVHYKRITDLLRTHGINIVSVDCDGQIDALVPIWLENGVNTMFPIEVGVWNASIKPWREKYGQALRGIGGVRKAIFAEDFAAIDAEIERLKPLVELGGYIPCPDHRIPADAKWENVQYYCNKMRKTFG